MEAAVQDRERREASGEASAPPRRQEAAVPILDSRSVDGGGGVTRYEVCVYGLGAGAKMAEIDASTHDSLASAKSGIERFKILYPGITTDAEGMIFVRQHVRGKNGFRVLHRLTVKGSAA
jgi:hypothetical protein